MVKSNYRVVGLMSGTSLDGLDIALCDFQFESGKWNFELIDTEFLEYSEAFKERLKNSTELSSVDLLVLNNQYGSWLGEQTNIFLKRHSVRIDFVASHGHTVFHQIDKGLTYQIGDGQCLANTSRQKVICDFRSMDVSLGGQGAPLVPIGDQLLFSEYDFCLNLGGISNVSFQHNNARIAFDISPVNMLLSYILIPKKLAYDDKGNLARTGNIDAALLAALNQIDYYSRPYPKSLGYEWFCDQVKPIITAYKGTVEDALNTSIHHIAIQIASALKTYGRKGAKLLITGGGAKNSFLIETLAIFLGQDFTVEVPDDKIIDFKEALIFAFMGVLKERNEINSLKSVTGAKSDASSGVIYKPCSS